MTQRRIVSLATLFATIAAAAGLFFYLKPEDSAIEVDCVRVAKGEVRETVASAASGDVKPLRRVTVRAEIAGTVREVKKKKGDRVEALELAVSFQSEEIDARVLQARANVDAARVSVKMAETRLDTAERALGRAKRLRQGDAISDVELDRAETDVVSLKEGVEQAKASLSQVLAAEEISKVAKTRSMVKAPFSGVLQEVFAETGVQMAPGQALFDLIDDSGVKIDVPIDESDVARVSKGQRVILKSDSARGVPLFGTVTLIPPAVGKSSDVSQIDGAAGALSAKDRSLYVVVSPDDPKMLRVGSSVGAELLVRVKDGVLFVPSNAVLGRGATRTVLRVEGGLAKRVPIRAGLVSWERTEIESGLAAGDVVISTLNARDLDDGTKVKVRTVSDPPALVDPRPDLAAGAAGAAEAKHP